MKELENISGELTGDPSARKRLVVVDDAVTGRNPGISSLVQAVPELVRLGWRVEVRAAEVDRAIREMVDFRRTPQPGFPSWLPILPFFARHVIDGFRLLNEMGSKKVLISTGGHFLFADVTIFQFYNKAWWDIQTRGVESGPDSRWRRVVQVWGRFEDWLALKSPRIRSILPASDAIAADLRRDFPDKAIQVLPNCVDAGRFDRELRKSSHGILRKELGMREGELSLLFVSQGHYTRKGFWLAAKVLRLMVERGEKVRMFVLGGKEGTLAKLRAYLDRSFPGWEEAIVLVGWTDRVPDYMAAADALFMPSYFEAFSLVEIEAAAMGLPLLLTPHHGSEMILNEGVNGMSIPFDADGIVEKLIEFKKNPVIVEEPQLGRALTVEEYAHQLDEILSEVLVAKSKSGLFSGKS